MNEIFVVLAKSKIADKEWEVIGHYALYYEATELISYHGNSWACYKIEKWFTEILK